MRVGIVGAGLIGTRRAGIIAESDDDYVVAVADTDLGRAKKLAAAHDRAISTSNWEEIIELSDVDAVVVSTVNKWLSIIASSAIRAGKHVLVEKPAGRSLVEVMEIERSSQGFSVAKVGLNLRHHPAVNEAHQIVESGELGRLLHLRAVYGHGGRTGYEKEWRASKELAGGGELLDQGVHIADLFNWFAGPARAVYVQTKAAYWNVAPLEDNALGTVEFKSGAEGVFHTSWTQWKNRFDFQVYGELGAVEVSGLGGSYGVEQLTVYRRSESGRAPGVERREYPGEDISWEMEWREFRAAISEKRSPSGSISDGVAAMRLIDAMYRSSRSHERVSVN
jgi:predicted dehydrogenase